MIINAPFDLWINPETLRPYQLDSFFIFAEMAQPFAHILSSKKLRLTIGGLWAYD